MFKRFLMTALFCAAWPRAGLCAPTFELEDGVRLASASLHCVTTVPGGYRMYFSTPSAYSVLSAISPDGLAWTAEAGARLSPRASFLDASSITALGLYYDAALAGGPYHAYYVGISTGGHALLSAKSSDGLTWTNDAAFALLFSTGATRLRSPRAYFAGAGKVNLYYIRDSGGDLPPEDFNIYGMQSLDNGVSFSGETLLVNVPGAYTLDVSTLTDGRLRMLVAAPGIGVSTVTRVLAADSVNGTSFPSAPVQVFSTAAANELTGIAVTRSTETFRWRLYLTSRLNSESTTYIYSALTNSPVITAFSPTLAYIDDPATNFTVTGEIFSTALASAAITLGSGGLAVPLVTRLSDLSLTVNAVPTNAALGIYSVNVTNPDGRSASLSNVLTLDYHPGSTRVRDNLFRPLKGETAKAAIVINIPGKITATIYTINGGLVKKLFEGQAPAGTKNLTWGGETESGKIAASGLYLLHVTGPKLKDTRKIVLIK